MEHRWGQRVSADVMVRLIGAPGAIGTGRLRNVSATGAFVQTNLDLPLLTTVRVEWIAGPPPAGHPCAGRAYVVRQVAAGVGIEWFAVALDAIGIRSRRLTTRHPVANAMSVAPEMRHR
jgi:PilZ domain-containing protein